MAREFVQNIDVLPGVDVPDWELLAHLEELFTRYRQGKRLSVRLFTATDRRGRYDAETLDELRGEIEAQEDPPREIMVSVYEPEEGGFAS